MHDNIRTNNVYTTFHTLINLKVFDDNQQWGVHKVVEKLVNLAI